MKQPKVIHVTLKKMINKPPPKGIVDKDVKGVPSCYVKRNAFEILKDHCRLMAKEDNEAMGLLVGQAFSWNGKMYSVVHNAITAPLESSKTSVRFERDGFESLFIDLDRVAQNHILVGWYHSHPGYGCFMSEKDILTQREMFRQPFHVAIVIDPLDNQRKAFGINKDGKLEVKVMALIE
jgi:proteasome lid subunit RPN8/RPN11